MILELIYTSAPRTLDGPGYGVVARSANLPERLEAFIRQLNRYDFELPTHSDSAPFAPAVFSHTTFADHAATWHVLSRVGPGGFDYSQRAVYLAHHVALTGDELQAARVTSLLQDPSMFQSEWDGHVGEIPAREVPMPARRKPPQSDRYLGAGHLDWLKAWGETRDQQNDRANFLIVAAGADVLEVFAEALALFSPKAADNVTFITHMNADRPGVHFDWIGLVAGSDLARSIAGRFPDRTLDLTKPYVSSRRTPARKEHAAAVTTRPKKQAVVTGPPITPVRRDQDFDAIWQDEVRSQRDPEILHEPAEPSFAPPPPPPPSSAFGRIAIPIIAVAVVLSAAIIGFTAWRLGKHSKGPDAASHQGIEGQPSGPEVNGSVPIDVGSPSARDGTKPINGKSKEDGTGDGGARQADPASVANKRKEPDRAKPAAGSEPAKASAQPRIYYLKRWLWDSERNKNARKNNESQEWVKVPVADGVDTQINAFGTPVLKILSCKGSELTFARPSEQSPDGEIEVWFAGQPRPKDPIGLHVKQGALEMKGMSDAAGDLFGALQLSILQIEDLVPQVVPLRIAFTPQLPPIPIFDSKNKADTGVEASAFAEATRPIGASIFFEAIEQMKNSDVHLRVDRVTLAICPPADAGWPLKPNPEARIARESKLDFEVPVNYARIGLPVPISLSKSVEKSADGDYHSIKAALIAPPPADRDHDLLYAVFKRFGLVHGSIVVHVTDGTSDLPIDLLQFGKPRELANGRSTGSE